jgi:hypothetical protein
MIDMYDKCILGLHAGRMQLKEIPVALCTVSMMNATAVDI